MVKSTEIQINDENMRITFVEVCHQYAISEEMLFELLEYGLLTDVGMPNKKTVFTSAHLQRILSACRLRTDLEINTQGVILALELMDELTGLRRELDMLRRHMHNP